MKAVLLKCRPNAQFHFGKVALDVDTSLSDTAKILHSDTIFSALIVTINTIFPGYTKRFVKHFSEGVIKMSSGFYCVQIGQEYVYFLPKPIHYNLEKLENTNKEDDCQKKMDRKFLKKVLFISKEVWEHGYTPKQWPEKCLILQGEFVISKEEFLAKKLDQKWPWLKFYSENTLPKVSVHKPTKEASLYNQTNIQIADNRGLGLKHHPLVHLYFLLDHQLSEEDFELFQTALSVLEDTGIGGERSVGCGQIEEICLEDFNYTIHEASNMQCLLSLVNPTRADLVKLKYYNVVTRGGRKTAKDGTLKRVRMLSEGGIVSNDLDGQIPVIDNKGLYLRYGKAFSIPVSQKTISNDLFNQ